MQEVYDRAPPAFASRFGFNVVECHCTHSDMCPFIVAGAVRGHIRRIVEERPKAARLQIYCLKQLDSYELWSLIVLNALTTQASVGKWHHTCLSCYTCSCRLEWSFLCVSVWLFQFIYFNVKNSSGCAANLNVRCPLVWQRRDE